MAEIKKIRAKLRPNFYEYDYDAAKAELLEKIEGIINALEVKEADVHCISESLAEADEYLDYTTTGNLAHNKPMINARLKRAMEKLYNAGLFELTHDEEYRMKSLGIKAKIETLHEAGQHSSAMWLKSIKQRIAQ